MLQVTVCVCTCVRACMCVCVVCVYVCVLCVWNRIIVQAHLLNKCLCMHVNNAYACMCAYKCMYVSLLTCVCNQMHLQEVTRTVYFTQ